MGDIRALEPADIAALAGLFTRIFGTAAPGAQPALEAYLHRLYLEAPGFDAEIPPLVHVGEGGALTGFVGVNTLPMRLGGRSLRAAICGSLMVEGRESDPLAGARLMKAFLAGPQDLSLSETASEVSAQMWSRLRGFALPQYSLDWVRVIRPYAFLADMAGERIGAARLLAPLARGLDSLHRKRMEPRQMRWSGVPHDPPFPERRGQAGLEITEIGREEFAELVGPLSEHFALRPDWPPQQLERMLEDATQKPQYGAPVVVRVSGRGGRAVGAFFYHVRPGAVARVLQVLALPGQEGAVVDCLIADASARGAAALRGRTQPALLEAMLGRRIAFTHVASTVAHARDAEVARALRGGEAFLNGLAGEHWSRLIGGRFD